MRPIHRKSAGHPTLCIVSNALVHRLAPVAVAAAISLLLFADLNSKYADAAATPKTTVPKTKSVALPKAALPTQVQKSVISLCVGIKTSLLRDPGKGRCTRSLEFSIQWGVRSVAPQLCISKATRYLSLGTLGRCLQGSVLAKPNQKNMYFLCAQSKTGYLRLPVTKTCLTTNSSVRYLAVLLEPKVPTTTTIPEPVSSSPTTETTSTTTTTTIPEPVSSSPTTGTTSTTTTTTSTTTTVAPVAAPAINLSSYSESQTQNVAIAGYAVTSTGGEIANYSIAPAAPAGASFNTFTGLLSGTPTDVQSATDYVITATNATGSASQTFRLTVTLAAPGVSGQPTGVAGDGQVTVTVAAGMGGTPASFVVSAVSDATKTCTVTGSSGSCVVTGLTNGTEYRFIATATNSTGTSTASTASAAVTSATTSSAPTGISITPGDTSLSIAFSAGADGGSALTNYEYSTDGGLTFKARATVSTTSPIVITTVSSGAAVLANGSSYDVQVRAVNAIGSGTATFTAVATPRTVPGVPTIGTATATGSTTATIGFTAPGSDGGATVTSYTATSSPGGKTGTVTQAGSGTITVSGLTTGTAYTFVVTATNSAGTSVVSAVSNSITTFAIPSAPTGISITPGDTSLSIAFSAGADGGSALTNYEYSTDGGLTFKARATVSTTSPIVITTVSSGAAVLANGSSYDVQVRAVNAIGSGTATFTAVATPRTVPGVPTIGTATATGSTTATIGFTAPGSDGGATVTSYTATSSPGGKTGTVTQAGSGTITVSGLTTGTAYTFVVTATNSAGTSVVSAVSNSITPVAALAFTLSSYSESQEQNSEIVGFRISATGGAIASYAISPTQPAGMSFSTSTGLLAGAPTTVQSATDYVITATNATSTASKTFTLTVRVPCAISGECLVGDTGPGGGKVFYRQASNGTFACGATLESLCKYLEAAPTSGMSAWTDATYQWSGNTTDLIGTQWIHDIGTGYSNTVAMVTQDATASRAGSITRDYRGPNDLSDWYLPSKTELRELCKFARKQVTGTAVSCAAGGTMRSGFLSEVYWGSSEGSKGTHGDLLHFKGGGSATSLLKTNTYYVRPVRAF